METVSGLHEKPLNRPFPRGLTYPRVFSKLTSMLSIAPAVLSYWLPRGQIVVDRTGAYNAGKASVPPKAGTKISFVLHTQRIIINNGHRERGGETTKAVTLTFGSSTGTELEGNDSRAYIDNVTWS